MFDFDLVSSDSVLFASPELITIPVANEARAASFVIDPWTQRWALLASGAESLLRLANGSTTLGEMTAALTGASSEIRLFSSEADVHQLARELLANGLLFQSRSDHERSGLPVYNLSEVLGLHLEITNACNMSCRHCYVSSGQRLPDELSDEELRSVVDQLPPFSGRAVYISGGEPAVRRGCFELVEYCAIERGHAVDLYTNGYRFPKHLIPKLENLIDRSPTRIRLQVSLEGATPRTNDLVRGVGAFEKTMETLEAFKTAGLNRNTTVLVCITKANVRELDAIIRLAEDLDIADLKFSQWQRQGNAADTPWQSIAPSTEEWVASGNKLLQYDNPRLRITGNFFGDLTNTSLGGFTLENSLFPKHVYFYNVVPRVSPDGEIWADQLWTDPEWSLGNVREIPLADAFASPKFLAQLEAMRSRLDRTPECQQCVWRSLCECGSPGHTFAEYGTLDRKDLFCESRISWFEEYVRVQVASNL